MSDTPDARPIAFIAVALVLLLGGGAWWLSRPAKPANASPKIVNATDAPIDKPSAAPPVDLPPLDRMDDFLRPMLSALSSRPELAKWLATDDLVRQLAVAIDRAAAGGSPSREFKVIAPATPFKPAGRGDRWTIDPASYRRYDNLVQTVTSIDASAAARVYKTIRPRLNEAYQGLGHSSGNVDQAVAKTLDILLDTPVEKDPVALLEAGGAGWAFADEDLERLEPTQKQLLRMGSANVERLLVWLRAFRDALQ